MCTDRTYYDYAKDLGVRDIVNNVHRGWSYRQLPCASLRGLLVIPARALMALHSLSSRLPIEVLDKIFRGLPKLHDQYHILFVNSVFFQISFRILYHTIGSLAPSKLITLLKTLCRNERYPPLVKNLDIDLADKHLTGNFHRLLNEALRRLHNLVSLNTAIDHHISLFEGCIFSLNHYSTTSASDSALASFLQKQPRLTELCLRSKLLPSFKLPQLALPSLHHIRVQRSTPSRVAHLIRGRPVEDISLFTSTEQMIESLDSLTLSSTPMRRLSMIFYESPMPAEIFTQAALRVPELEALHIVITLNQWPSVSFDKSRRNNTN